jgi:hypothetical protein
MPKFDPLEETQENLHPVIVAHRAREAGSLRAAPGDSAVRLRFATVGLLLVTGAVLFWLCFPTQA